MLRIILPLLLLCGCYAGGHRHNDDWSFDYTSEAIQTLQEHIQVTPEEFEALVVPEVRRFLPNFQLVEGGVTILFNTKENGAQVGYCCINGHPEVNLNRWYPTYSRKVYIEYVAAVICHECGHWLGLNHVEGEGCAIMSPTIYVCDHYWSETSLIELNKIGHP